MKSIKEKKLLINFNRVMEFFGITLYQTRLSAHSYRALIEADKEVKKTLTRVFRKHNLIK